MKEEIFVPFPLAEQLEEMAAKMGESADEIAEYAIRKFLDWSDTNGE